MSWRAQGMRPWLWQRMSALYLALFILVGLVWFVSNPPPDYSAWRAMFAQPVVNIALILFFVALLVHAWVGMRDIILDYVPPLALRFCCLSLVAFSIMAMGIWALSILFSVVSL